jgi:hypothetical protein
MNFAKYPARNRLFVAAISSLLAVVGSGSVAVGDLLGCVE